MKIAKGKLINGWQIRSWFDWLFTGASFLLFLFLEAMMLYAYFKFLDSHLR